MARRSAGAFALALVLSVSPVAVAAEPGSRVRCDEPLPERADAPGRGRLLVATPQLVDPNFAKAVILLLDSDVTGAVGVVVNRPSPIELSTVLPGLAPESRPRDRLFLGGPVGRFQLLLLVRSASPPAESMRILADVYVTASREALRDALGDGRSSSRFRLFAGYAGWAPGQLEAEIGRGDWRVVPGDPERVFAEDPARIWDELNERGQGRWVRRGPRSEWVRVEREARLARDYRRRRAGTRAEG